MRIYPDWTDGTPRTHPNATISRYRTVRGTRVIRVKGASYRNAALSGIFEVENQFDRDPIQTKPSGKSKVKIVCAWFGVIPTTTYPQLDITDAKYTIIKSYSGQVADNIS